MKLRLVLIFVGAAFAGCSGSRVDPVSEPSALPVVPGAELHELVSKSEVPILVEFGVDFQCDRCRTMQEGLAELAERFAGRASVVRVDFNSNVGLVSQFGGTICPTYVLFEDGQAVRTESFPVSADVLESHLSQLTDGQLF